MRVVLAPDSFKGTITADGVARALAEGWRSVDPSVEIVPRPMADGGEGTLAAFASAVPDARRMPVTVLGPDDRMREAYWLLLPPSPDAPGGTAVVELASTSGIELLDDLRPWDAHTEGCGEAISAALDAGVSRLVVGIGSSSSSDGGMGILRALGARFLDASGRDVPRGARGLASLASVDLAGLRPPVETLVVTDVTNPLCGPRGAAAVFGPQKGLDGDEVDLVDGALARYARLLRLAAGERASDPETSGAGAAGGTGFGLLSWGARLVPGAGEIARLVGLEEALAHADLVVTGEGSYDGQSAEGKVPGHVAEAAARAGARVAVVAGRVAPDAPRAGLAAAVSLVDLAGSAAAAMADPARWLREAGALLARDLG